LSADSSGRLTAGREKLRDRSLTREADFGLGAENVAEGSTFTDDRRLLLLIVVTTGQGNFSGRRRLSSCRRSRSSSSNSSSSISGVSRKLVTEGGLLPNKKGSDGFVCTRLRSLLNGDEFGRPRITKIIHGNGLVTNQLGFEVSVASGVCDCNIGSCRSEEPDTHDFTLGKLHLSTVGVSVGERFAFELEKTQERSERNSRGERFIVAELRVTAFGLTINPICTNSGSFGSITEDMENARKLVLRKRFLGVGEGDVTCDSMERGDNRTKPTNRLTSRDDGAVVVNSIKHDFVLCFNTMFGRRFEITITRI
jgi:hypothetical protein